MKTIIDISHHQLDFPWDQVKDEVDFIIVRPSHGMNDTDKEWTDNLKWLTDHPDEKFAVYHYFYYKELLKHRAELENFLKHIRPLLKLKNFTGLAFLDFEHPSDVGTSRPIAACTPTEMTDYLISDCNTLIKEGFVPGLYASVSWLTNKMQPNRFPHECVIWAAHYDVDPGSPRYSYRWDIHQYTSQGSLKTTDMFKGSLDLDYINPKTEFKVIKDVIKEVPTVHLVQLGDISDEVGEYQQILLDRAYDIKVDKKFGPKTKLIVKEFQTDNGLYIDGIIGPQTADALKSLRIFSLKADGEKLVREDCPNFKVKEFACSDKSDKIVICLIAVKRAQAIRNQIGKSMIINSGYRTKSYNATLKNSNPKSLHTKGYAIDFYFQQISGSKMYAKLSSSYPGGLGKYSNFTHIDSGRRRRWNG